MLKKLIAVAAGVLIAVIGCGSAQAFTHGNRYGGSTSHSFGATSHTNAFGGSSTHEYGVGTEHTNMYGGGTAHSWYGGTEHTNVYGGKTYGELGEGAVHTTPYGATAYRAPYYGAVYPAYHPPTTVNYYGTTCYNCGGWSTAGAVAAGAMIGVAAATMATSTTNANQAAATQNAYNAGYVAGTTAARGAYTAGSIFAVLPAGCTASMVGSTTYYVCSGSYLVAAYGANGVYYKVVPAP